MLLGTRTSRFVSFIGGEDLKVRLEALDSLIEDSSTELVLTNEYLDLIELKQTTPLSTLAAAKEALLRQLKQDGRIYKIHSPQGEFVQCKKFALGCEFASLMAQFFRQNVTVTTSRLVNVQTSWQRFKPDSTPPIISRPCQSL